MMSAWTRARLGLAGVLAATLLVAACTPTEACLDTIAIQIIDPSPDANIRGHSCGVYVHAWTTGSLKVKTIVVLYNDVEKWCHTYDTALTDVYDSDDFCTFEIANTSGVLKAKAYAEDGIKFAVDTQTNPVDNAYRISVTRGTPGAPGTVTWQRWTGTAWSTLTAYCTGGGHLNTSCSGWDCTTCGNTDCTGQCTGYYCCHGTPHTYCHYGGTPPFTGTWRNYPTIGGKGDPVCDGDYGTAYIILGSATATCGCSRTGIWIHGDWVAGEEHCPASQPLACTHGCVRMRNGQVQTLYNIVNAAYSRVTYSNMHVSVPNP